MPDEENLETQLRYRKLLAEVEKAELELKEIRRPYLFRNPQAFTALVGTVGVVFSVWLFVQNNSVQVLRERFNLAKQQTDAAQGDLSRKEAQVKAAQDELRGLQAMNATVGRENSELVGVKKLLQGENTKLLVERDLLPFPRLLSTLYGPHEPSNDANSNLIQEILRVPAERRNAVLDRLYEIPEPDSPFLTSPPSGSSKHSERDACLSAALLIWSGEAKWLSRLKEATTNYLDAHRTPSAGASCIDYYYRALPASYDGVRIEFLRRVEQRLEALRLDDESLADAMLLGYSPVFTNVMNVTTNTPRPARLGGSREDVKGWFAWEALLERLFIPERDVASLPDDLLVGIAEARRPFVLQGRGSRWTFEMRDRRQFTGTLSSVVPPFCQEIYGVVLMRLALSTSTPKSLATEKYAFLLSESLTLQPIGHRIIELEPTTFSQGEWEAMASWLNKNTQIVELLARGSPREIAKRLSPEQVRRLIANQWIEDTDLSKEVP